MVYGEDIFLLFRMPPPPPPQGARPQPFCQEAEQCVGEFLDITESLYPVQVEFSTGDQGRAQPLAPAQPSQTFGDPPNTFTEPLRKKLPFTQRGCIIPTAFFLVKSPTIPTFFHLSCSLPALPPNLSFPPPFSCLPPFLARTHHWKEAKKKKRRRFANCWSPVSSWIFRTTRGGCGRASWKVSPSSFSSVFFGCIWGRGGGAARFPVGC